MRAILAIASIALLIGTSMLHAQTVEEKERAARIAWDAIKIIDEGDLDRGLKMLRDASALDPSTSVYKYEQGYVYEMKGEYAKAKEIVEPLLAASDAGDRYYQLVGNCYDFLKDPEKAIKTYYAGLKRFPNSGELHLELGVMALGQKDYDKAVDIWEKGLNADPMFPSNYYWAAKFYCNSDHRFWGLLYGEIFINLEPGTKRTREISELLYKTYNKSIVLGRDSSSISFVPAIVVSRKNSKGEPVLPLVAPYFMNMSMAIVERQVALMDSLEGGRTLTIDDLHHIRQSFLERWFKDSTTWEYPSVLFDWQRKVAKNGYDEAYDYWLLAHGNYDEFAAWAGREGNEEKMKEFFGWLRESHLAIDSAHAFNRIRVDEGEE